MQDEICLSGKCYLEDDLINAREVAFILGLTQQTLYNWRAFDRGPAFIRLNSSLRKPLIRYRVSDVKSYIDKIGTGGKRGK